MLEVELKFPLRDEDDLIARLGRLGAVAGPNVLQADAYYNHPARDFAVTDEALRIRSIDGRERLTYKGPRQGGATKSREEIELPLADGSGEAFSAVLLRLGFRAVATVRKRRTSYRLERAGRSFEITLDAVEGLGSFVEVETVVDQADRDAAEAAVLALAVELGLESPEPRSYLEMLLDAGGCA